MSCKLFAHRGFSKSYPDIKENTLKSFQNAIDNGFEGIELDIWYIEDQFILNHDKPEFDIKKYDKLADLFAQCGNKIHYWIDFKGLVQIDIESAIKRLKTTIDEHKIAYENIFFIPGLDNKNLDQNAFAYKEIRKNFGENCNLGVFIGKIKKEDLHQYYKDLKTHKIKILSILFKNIDEDFMDIFHDINLFAWTVNHKSELDYLEKLGVQNIATDVLKTENTMFL